MGEIWHSLFDKDNQIPLQKTITLLEWEIQSPRKKELITKKLFCQNLDTSCNKLDVQRKKMDDMRESFIIIINNARRDHNNKKGKSRSWRLQRWKH
jgi:hypothetical protein